MRDYVHTYPQSWRRAATALSCVIVLLGSAWTCWAGDGITRGRIIEGTTGEPIPGQLVKLTEFDLPQIETVFRLMNNMNPPIPADVGTRETTTDAEGCFQFEGLSEGRFYYLWTPWSFEHEPDSSETIYEAKAGHVWLCEGEAEKDLGDLEAFHFEKIVFRIRGTVTSNAFPADHLYVRVCREVPNRRGYEEVLEPVNPNGTYDLELDSVKGAKLRVSAGALTQRVKDQIAEMVEKELPNLADGPLQSQLLYIKQPPYDGIARRFVLDPENPDIHCDLELPEYRAIRGRIALPANRQQNDGGPPIEVRLMSEPVNPFPEVCYWAGFAGEEGEFETDPMPMRDHWVLVSRGDNFDVREVSAEQLRKPLLFDLSQRLRRNIETVPVNIVIERHVPESLEKEEWKKRLLDRDCRRFVVVVIPLESGLPENWLGGFQTAAHVQNWSYVMPEGVMWNHPFYQKIPVGEYTMQIEYLRPLERGKKYRFILYLGHVIETLGIFCRGFPQERILQEAGEPVRWGIEVAPQWLYKQPHVDTCRYFVRD